MYNTIINFLVININYLVFMDEKFQMRMYIIFINSYIELFFVIYFLLVYGWRIKITKRIIPWRLKTLKSSSI